MSMDGNKRYFGWIFIAMATAGIALLAAGLLWLATSSPDASAGIDKRHVLVMFSENIERYKFIDIENIILKAFKNKDVNADITFDYLACEYYDAEHEVEEARKIVERNNRHRPIDMLVTIGDQATYSTLCNDLYLLHHIPVVFGGVQFPNWQQLADYPNVTGASDSIDIIRNIHAAYTLTGIKHTFITINKTFLDRKMHNEADKQLRANNSVRNNLHWKYSIMELLTDYEDSYSLSAMSLRHLSLNVKQGDTLNVSDGDNLRRVIRMFKDLVYIQVKYDPNPVPTIRTSNHQPMLTATWKGFGDGNTYIGGYFASAEDIADDVADYAKRIFDGADPKDLKIRPTRKDYYLDWSIAKKHGFTHDNLPEGYKVVNMPWKDKYPILYTLFLYSGFIATAVAFFILIRLLLKERRQKKEIIKQLERENTLYNMAVKDSPTFAWERKGSRINISKRFWEYCGKEPRIITTGDFMEMLHPDSRDSYIEGIEHVNKGEFFTKEVQADFLGNGEWHWYQIRGKGLINDSGELEKSYGMFTNVDSFKQKEKEMNEALKKAEEATLKESFLANMSHEIRTPLNAIVGFSNLILQPDADFTDEEKKMFAETINTNNDLLLKLINDILDVSRMESGHMDFMIKPYRVKELMDHIHQTFILQIPQHLKFIYNNDDDVTVNVDEGRLRQVITNFLTNASKFTPEGSITLGWNVNRQTGKVELYVEDTGIGLSEEDRKMVFSRFFKKDEFKQGTGLGLSICKAIVVRLKGEIKVKSQLGKGSRFSVYLGFTE